MHSGIIYMIIPVISHLKSFPLSASPGPFTFTQSRLLQQSFSRLPSSKSLVLHVPRVLMQAVYAYGIGGNSRVKWRNGREIFRYRCAARGIINASTMPVWYRHVRVQHTWCIAGG